MLEFHLINLVICSLFVSSAILVAGWNLTILNADSTSFNLQWTGLDASVNHRAEFYLIEVKSAEGILLAMKTVPGNTSSTDIKGLSPSSTYCLVVFGVDETGQPYKSLERVVTTKKGMDTWVKCLHINACYIYSLRMVLFQMYLRKELLGKNLLKTSFQIGKVVHLHNSHLFPESFNHISGTLSSAEAP